MILGIDLAGSEKRNTGICVMDNKLNVKTEIVHTDKEIKEVVEEVNPKVIAIDAPLSLPKGRKSIDERNNIHFRKCDKELLKMGIKFFPITLGPMRMLTKRGIKLKKKFENKYKVIEVYPGGAQDILKIPRKQKGLDKLRNGLKKLGIKGLKKEMNGDELDAVTAAYVGKLYLDGKYVVLGDKKEGLMIMPAPGGI